ncbi:hypothetical protein KDA06_01810 [Candidatus Saccharibacteria bacterium]|jgi:hypothetical protein|nr:hypothetical protein [Candidatus Saccharibacteria bacterium]
MAFNHYAKLKRIIDALEPGWYIKRINRPTTAKTFRGETRFFNHYYRLYDVDGSEVKFGKFQQLDRLASVLGCDAYDLPVR